MKRVYIVLFFVALYGTAHGQGNDFPTFPSLPPFNPPPLIVPDRDPILPSVISPGKKAEAAAAADHYDADAQGFDNFTTYWCNLNVLVCGVMATSAPVMRIYSAFMRRIQRDPLDPHFREPVDPVVPSAADLGLSYLPSDHPAAGYLNWLVGNAQSSWAWAEMVRVTADRAGTCLWLIRLPSSDCDDGIFQWQMARLNWGLEQLASLQDEAGRQIAPWLRDWLWNQGLGGEGWLYNDVAATALQAARGLRGETSSSKSGGSSDQYYDLR